MITNRSFKDICTVGSNIKSSEGCSLPSIYGEIMIHILLIITLPFSKVWILVFMMDLW